jgi:type IV pilus assembly protein PilX
MIRTSSKAARSAPAQRGAALVVGLIMLVVLTILAITGMNVASTELVMAGTEQDRVRAFNAAETGVERAARAVGDVGTAPGAELTVAATDVEGSSVNASTGAATERYTTTTRYRGENTICPGSTQSDVVAFHYEIESEGTAARGATSVHTQGVYICNVTGGQESYGPL